MIYEYKCTSVDCKDRNVEISIVKPISESDRKEYCKECKNILQRVFGIGGIKTGDGYKN